MQSNYFAVKCTSPPSETFHKEKIIASVILTEQQTCFHRIIQTAVRC